MPRLVSVYRAAEVRVFSEFDVVVLKSPVAGSEIKPGARGTIVHVHSVPNTAYMVEFCNDAGETLDLVSLLPTQIDLAAPLRQAA